MKAGHINKFNDDCQLRNIEEKSSLSSDEHELEMSLQIHHTDGSDESDVVEHDVKVCDTCGDAGREDLLAICCRCIDGAEHTYCMRETVDQVPKGDWLCEECKLEAVKNTNQQSNSTENSAGKEQSSSSSSSFKRRAEELVSSSSFKKQSHEAIIGSTKDVDRGKVKAIYPLSYDSHFGNASTEGSHSPATRPRLQSLRGAFSKSSSFSFPNARSKTKLVDEIVLQRQKSTKERSSHDAIATKEMLKPMSFRSTNLGSFGPSGSKVKMLSPKLAHVQDLKNKNERSFEKSNSVKLASSGSNAEVKPLKGDSKMVSGLKSTNRSANISTEASISLAQSNEQLLTSSPTRVGTASSSGIVNSFDQKSIDSSSKAALSKEPTTGLNTGVCCQNNKQTGHSAHGNNVSAIKTSKDVKNRDDKLKDAIEAALLKKPGIYRKNKVSDQPDDIKSSVSTMNHEPAVVDRVLTSNVDHSKQSNGSSYKQLAILSAEGKHFTTGLSSHDDVAFSSLLKNSPIPIRGHECIWQGSFEINRSGKTAEFWDVLQAHLSACASSRVFEAVNKFPHKILLNGVSRASAWPTRFVNNGVKDDNIAIYFFAKDIDSYERSYRVLLDDMIRGDLALIGSINGVELLIFPSNRLPEKSDRWNMLFFLWGVFRGKKNNSLHQIPNDSEKNCDSEFVSSVPTDKIQLAENAGLFVSVEEDKHVDPESMVNSNLQNSSHEKAIASILIPVDSVKHVDAESKVNSNTQNSSHEKAIDSISRPVDRVKHVDPESKVNSYMQNLSSPVDSVKTVDLESKVNSNMQNLSRTVDSVKHVDLESKVNSNMQNFSHEKAIGSISRAVDGVKHVDLESKVNSNMQNSSHEKAIDSISRQVDSVNIVPVSNKVIISDSLMQNEPIKRPFIDLSEDDNVNGTCQTNTDQESKKQKTQQTPVFALDLNEDITCLVGETDNIIMTKKDADDEVASSLSLSLAFSPPDDR